MGFPVPGCLGRNSPPPLVGQGWAFAGDESAGGDDLRPCVVLFHPLRGQPRLQRHIDPNGQVSAPIVPRLSGLQALQAIDHPALVVPSDRG
jgi:hypothetical protein